MHCETVRTAGVTRPIFYTYEKLNGQFLTLPKFHTSKFLYIAVGYTIGKYNAVSQNMSDDDQVDAVVRLRSSK